MILEYNGNSFAENLEKVMAILSQYLGGELRR